jgi:hypothetical protein
MQAFATDIQFALEGVWNHGVCIYGEAACRWHYLLSRACLVLGAKDSNS